MRANSIYSIQMEWLGPRELVQKNSKWVKHSGGSVMIWCSFSSNSVGKLVFIEGIMRKEQYLDILKTSMLESAAMLVLQTSLFYSKIMIRSIQYG